MIAALALLHAATSFAVPFMVVCVEVDGRIAVELTVTGCCGPSEDGRPESGSSREALAAEEGRCGSCCDISVGDDASPAVRTARSDPDLRNAAPAPCPAAPWTDLDGPVAGDDPGAPTTGGTPAHSRGRFTVLNC